LATQKTNPKSEYKNHKQKSKFNLVWVNSPRFAAFVIPAKAGIQENRWIPGQARNDGQEY
jgi:hypothetical protein